MIEIQVVDPKVHLPKGNAYSQSLAARLRRWAAETSRKPSSEEATFKQPQYMAAELNSMASGLLSDEGSQSPWRGVYSVATLNGQMLAMCKTNSPEKKAKVDLIVSMPDFMRVNWPSPSPVSCLLAEVAFRNQSSVLLQAEVPELVEFYQRYGFETTGGGGTKPEMILKDYAQLTARYGVGKAWRYSPALPEIPT